MMATGMKREKRTENCEKHGQFTSEHYRLGQEAWWSKCPTCAEEERIEREKESERKEREMRVRRLIELGCSGDRWRSQVLQRRRGLHLQTLSW